MSWLQGIIQLGMVFMQMAPIAFSLAGEAIYPAFVEQRIS